MEDMLKPNTSLSEIKFLNKTIFVYFLCLGVGALLIDFESVKTHRAYWVCHGAQRPQEKVLCYDAITRMGSIQPDDFFNLGHSYFLLGQYQEAALSLTKAIALSPKPEYYYYLDLCNEKSGKKHKTANLLSPAQP